MTQIQTLQYQATYDREADKPPIGEVGLYYTALGLAVVGLHLAMKALTTGTEILLPLGVVFWGAGAVVSIMGTLRRPGRRCAVAGSAISIVGIALYALYAA